MPGPYESARINLELFDLRREPVLREARAWFLREVHPTTFEDLIALAGGPRNAAFRMVLGYWDMAASLVTSGAVDAASFLAAHGEIISTFALIEPFVAQLRAASDEPTFLSHIERVVTAMPNATETLARRRARIRAAAQSGAAPDS